MAEPQKQKNTDKEINDLIEDVRAKRQSFEKSSDALIKQGDKLTDQLEKSEIVMKTDKAEVKALNELSELVDDELETILKEE